MTTGTAVRDALNQGFMRAELASIADKQMRQVLGDGPSPVYEGSRATGTVAVDKVTNAIDNYKAAVSCFVRVLPSLTDPQSVELVRSEIRRLLARLGELQAILKKVKSGEDDTEEEKEEKVEEERTTNQLLHDLKFALNDEVVVDNVKFGKISLVDLEKGTYGVLFSDGTTETNIIEPRIQLRPILPLDPSLQQKKITFSDFNESERYELWSEIVESERAYRDSLKALVDFYLQAFDSPMQWGGEKQSNDTVFSKKAITEEERTLLFGNIQEISGASQIMFQALEERFLQWRTDQKLADVFLELASLYDGKYAEFAETYVNAVPLLRKLRQERSAFESVEMRAKKLGGAPPLEDLLNLPLGRPAQLKLILMRLAKRTKETHPDYQSIRDAFVLFGKVEEQIDLALNRVELENKVKDIEKLFDPPIALAKRGRRLLKSSLSLKRIEGPKAEPRFVWLFNDLIVIGRKSGLEEWGLVRNVGYRYVDRLPITKARGAPEYGPFAFEVGNDTLAWVFVTNSDQEKREWLEALKGFIPVKKNKRKSTTVSAPPPPPPPPPPAPVQQQLVYPTTTTTTNMDNHVQLGAETIKVMMKRKESQNLLEWRRARAKHTFKGEQLTDLPFKKGDIIEVKLDGPQFVENSWIVGRKMDTKESGQVPANYLELL